MTLNEYQQMAMRTSPRDGHDKIDNGVLGLIGETGEIIDVYKKFLYQSSIGTQLPREKIAEELGDVMWYIAELTDGMGARLRDIAGADFKTIDREAARRGGRSTNLRRAVMALHRRADMISRAVEHRARRDAANQIRRMLARAARMAFLCDTTLEAVCAANIEKLKARYPEGFDAEISMARYRKGE